MTYHTIKFVILICFFFQSHCFSQKQWDYSVNNIKIKKLCSTSPNPKGLILVLPGWNHSASLVCEKTDFCKQATEKGYTLILPEIKKSIYADSLYPETASWLKQEITFSWITNHLLPWIQKQTFYNPSKNNFIVGISTGGRGSAKIMLHLPDFFQKAYSLSGDFIPDIQPNDPLMNAGLGSISKFPSRWKQENLSLKTTLLQKPLILYHGGKDKIVPVQQSKTFYEKDQSGKIVLRIDPSAGHDFLFWKQCLTKILEEN